jgi:tetratricopeptide (TPR) repeat protein
VLLCDIAGLPGVGESEPDSGQFVVKIGNATGESQAKAHSAFVNGLGGFGEAHVPRLRLAEQGAGVSADIYDVAGDSLVAVRTAEHVDFEDCEAVCALVARELLTAQLDVAGMPDYDMTFGAAAQAWLGPGFPDNVRGNRLRALLQELGWSGGRFEHEGEPLPNPLALLEASSPLAGTELPSFTGPSHGDLHLRNILARGSLLKQDLGYWVIDVNWSAPAPLLYDQAYLELSAFLSGLARTDEGRVTPLIAKLENAEVMVPVELGFAATSLVRLVRRIRQETVAVLQEREQKRLDVWDKQMLFARVAAGLNWAAKPLDDPAQRKAALVWAAWAARDLLRKYEPRLLVEITAQAQSVPPQAGAAVVGAPITAAEALRRWAPFKSPNSGLDLFLVSDALDADPRLSVLAHGRWDGVLDFDPRSDEHGLSSMVLDELQFRRHVSRFGARRQLTNAGRATNWLMANGWDSRDEPSANSLPEWRGLDFPKQVQSLIDHVHDGTPNQKVAVLCIRTGRHDEFFDRAIGYIEDAYTTISLRLDLAARDSTAGVDLDAFLTFVTESLPSSGAKLVPALPMKNDLWEIPASDLRRLSADLEVLHTEVLSEESAREIQADAFWRGRPPTWTELEACLDVPRDACGELEKDLRARLTDHQLKTVELHHSPGAGGTTLARRVAWNLHLESPTAVLRVYTDGTVERINEIYQHTGQSVLVVAEASDLPEADRHELMEGLAQRNCRAVVLWIKRTNQRSGGGDHQVTDPLRGVERKRFLDEFMGRAKTSRGRNLLTSLADSQDSIVPHQRLSPFYFGLCVYDEDFEGVDSYVHNHLVRMNPRQREAARYLALITRYGQLGIAADVVRSWIGSARTDDAGEQALQSVLGEDLRHLVVVEDGTLRLLHPLIAERILKGERDNEQRSLGLTAVDFIKKLTEVLGPKSHVGSRLLTELFVRRSSPTDQGAQQKTIFSELIQAMSEEEAVRVFEELTERCPNEPHFWNHRGRYRIYRVRGDFEKAEDDLKKAVEMAHGRDPIHLHTLGMVRRFWVEKITGDLLATHTADSAEQMLELIEPIYNSAMEAFEQARAIKDSEHNWSTPIQLIATVVDHLVKASGSDSLAEFLESGTSAGRWATDALQRAENYLDGLRNLHPEGKFYRKLTDELDSLYGDLELLIERWIEFRTQGDEDGSIGLMLAHALFVRANRDWSRVGEEHLKDIAEMLEARVENGLASDSDLRLWFQAYRRLPQYAESRAMMLLSSYARRGSLDANYYMYILHFLMWSRGDKQDQERIRYYMEECRNAGVLSRRQWSYEWLGDTSRNPPLVHFSELGERVPGSGFWTIPFSLARVSGIIEDIQSPQAGRIRVSGGRLSAFFTPKLDFLETRDINAPVEFYLGFSYEGLRAWEVTYPDVKPPALTRAERLGPIDRTAHIVHHVSTKKAATTPPTPAPAEVPAPSIPPGELPLPERPTRPRIDPRFLASLQHEVETMGTATTGAKTPNTETTNTESYRDTILKLLMERQQAGHSLTALELGETLQTIYGHASYAEFRAGRKLRAAVEELGFRIIPTASGFDIGLP